MSEQKLLKNAKAAPFRLASALRAAWGAYAVLLVLPFPVFAVVIFSHSTVGMPPRIAHGVNRWFLLTMAYLAIGLPAALFYRRYLCSAYFRGNVVAPRQYLIGMLTVWLTLEVGMILPIIGCELTASFLPGLLPAIVAFMFFITLWPTGKMMVSRVGDREDPQIYVEPR